MNALRRVRLFAASVEHTRPSQLAARLRLVVKRLSTEALARVLPLERALHGRNGPALAEVLPRPLFAARRQLVQFRESVPYVEFLNQARPLTLPLDWHPSEWGIGPRLETLHLHYMEFVEGVDSGLFQRLVLDWIAQNPPYGRGYWRDAWNSYALSIRCVVWMQQIAARGVALAPEFIERARESLTAQLRFLESNLELDLGGNHLIKNIKALAWAGRFFEGAEARSWQALAEQLAQRELGEQVLADGHHFERSPAYHAQVLADLLELESVLPSGVVRTRIEERCSAMAQVLCDLTHPDGAPSLFNDGGLHMTYSPAECLAVHARAGTMAIRPRRVFALRDAGFFGVRGDGSLVVIDCGAIAPDHLPAHGHGDALAFEWSTGGRRLIVDAGVSEYIAGPWREWSRSTRAHNTVTVGGGDQCEFSGSFRVGRRARVSLEHFEERDGGIVLTGSHDGFAHLRGHPVHRRTFHVDFERLAIEDEVDGGDCQSVTAHLLLHPDAVATRNGGEIDLALGEIRARLSSASPMTIEEGWWSPDFGVRLRTTQIALHYGAAPCRASFRLERVAAPAVLAAAAPLPARITRPLPVAVKW